jgi:hypothetical protein
MKLDKIDYEGKQYVIAALPQHLQDSIERYSFFVDDLAKAHREVIKCTTAVTATTQEVELQLKQWIEKQAPPQA